MLVRFTATYIDEDTTTNGVFWIAKHLRHKGLLFTDPKDFTDDDRVWEILDWFNTNLPVPTKLNNSKNEQAEYRALSWFKDSAAEHIGYMRELTQILKKYGVIVDFIQTKNPGFITYQDDVQVVAAPFKDTPT
jgi:hypothetical protein